jgi:acetyl-CoA C-acetyltransferase
LDDELPRADTNAENLAKLPTVLGSPIVTAGNAPGQDAGACFVVLASRRACAEMNLQPLATVVSTASIARAAREIAIAPAPAVQTAIRPLGWSLDGLERLEINEAFACVPLVCARVLSAANAACEARLLDKLNVSGGAVAIGHPPGASGARLCLTLARELSGRGGGRGVAAICGGLCQADSVAMWVA